MATKKNGLKKLDLMSFYSAKHLGQFKKRAIELQENFVKLIKVKENSKNIDEYGTVEEFLEKKQIT